jgi:hypothetical protein
MRIAKNGRSNQNHKAETEISRIEKGLENSDARK